MKINKISAGERPITATANLFYENGITAISHHTAHSTADHLSFFLEGAMARSDLEGNSEKITIPEK